MKNIPKFFNKGPDQVDHKVIALPVNYKQQSGAVLVISLIMLLLLTLIGTTGVQSTFLEEKMAGNLRDRNLAFQAAESALKLAETSLSPTPPTFDNTSGFYNTAATPAVTTDSFWATATNSHDSGINASTFGLSNAPRYIIQDAGLIDCPGSAAGALDCHNYRVTTYAVGGTANAIVILQSIYQTH